MGLWSYILLSQTFLHNNSFCHCSDVIGSSVLFGFSYSVGIYFISNPFSLFWTIFPHVTNSLKTLWQEPKKQFRWELAFIFPFQVIEIYYVLSSSFAEIIEFVCFYLFLLLICIVLMGCMKKCMDVQPPFCLGYLEVLLPYILLKMIMKGDGIIIIQTGLSLIVIILTVMSISQGSNFIFNI